MPVDAAFAKRLPKCELHAHLTGSITKECLHEIWLQRRQADPDFPLEDPLTALAPENITHNIHTFFPLFTTYIYTLRSTLSTLHLTTTSVLKNFHADGICYLELRSTPQRLSDGSKADYVSTVLACISSFCAEHDMPTYLILSVDRRNTAREAMEVVELALRFRDRGGGGGGVVGVDLCGNPMTGLEMGLGALREAVRRAKAGGLGVTVHFAEVEESSGEGELRGLLDLGPDRLGHVVCVQEGGWVDREICERRMGVELCPTGNVAAGLTRGDLGDIILGDDVGLFNNPLSGEYLLAAEYFGLDEEDLLGLCDEASDVIFGGVGEKRRITERVDVLRKEMH